MERKGAHGNGHNNFKRVYGLPDHSYHGLCCAAFRVCSQPAGGNATVFLSYFGEPFRNEYICLRINIKWVTISVEV